MSLLVATSIRSKKFLKIRYQIRITSQDFYGVGSLWIIDLTHLPYGCSVGVSPDRVVSVQTKS
jgi:hypothetical protein